MRDLKTTIRGRRRLLQHVALATALGAFGAASAPGCGGGSTLTTGSGGTGGATTTSTKATTSSTGTGGTGGATTTSSTGTGGTGTGGTGTGGTGGMAPMACQTAAAGPTRGSALALTSDDKTVVAVNRDLGTVSVVSVDYSNSFPAMTLVAELPVGSTVLGTSTSEPWQVVIDGCDSTAYVVLRKDQAVVQILNVNTPTPTVGKSVTVGSEPTSLALTPHNTQLYVSNWVDGSLSVVDPVGMTVMSTIDLNDTIRKTGLLGPDVMNAATSRPALAHPRGIAITNSGGASDSVETVYATEWFAVRTAPEALPPASPNLGVALTADTNWKGLLYAVPIATGAATTIDLPPVANTGFNDANGNVTGCFPNQVASVSLDGQGNAYVTSTCASPAGPTGVFQKGACGVAAQCPAAPNVAACVNGACNNSCLVDADCGVGSAMSACNLAGNAGGGVCAPLAANAKTTTHPGLTIVNLAMGTGVTTSLDTLFTNAAKIVSGTVSTRMPLLLTDMDFKNSGGFGYVSAEGADAVFRLTLSAGAITQVGSSASNADNGNFITVQTAADSTLRLPIGVVTSRDQAFAFVNNDGERNVTALDLNAQAVAACAAAAPCVVSTTKYAPTAAQKSVLAGKRFFTTGLGRWSLNSAAWGSCAACHVDGLSDDVTWYFARGPRQTTSLDGTFGKNPPAGMVDQRVLNWTAVNDEIADFEGNVRSISGGVGAIVASIGGAAPPAACTVATEVADCPNSQVCNPATLTCTLSNKDRINTFAEVPSQQGLQGSSTDAAALAGSGHAHSVIANWADITNYVAQIRSPRGVSAKAPNAFTAADITAGQMLFTSTAQGNCIGCHSGEKWTLSTVFYTPGDTPNDNSAAPVAPSLSTISWLAAANAANFPATLFPTAAAGKQDMRSGLPPTFESLQCAFRPVGTIGAPVGNVPAGVSPAGVNVLELRQDMKTGAQGSGAVNANDIGAGYNVPSLLGLQVGAPYFHAGNARSLEESFTATFQKHWQSPVAQIFAPTPAQIQQLIAFLLSIDGSTAPVAIPALSNLGGDICHDP